MYVSVNRPVMVVAVLLLSNPGRLFSGGEGFWLWLSYSHRKPKVCRSEAMWSMRMMWLLSRNGDDSTRLNRPVVTARPARVEPLHVPTALGTARLTDDGFAVGSPRSEPRACR